MLRILARPLSATVQTLRQMTTGVAASAATKEKWDILAGFFVERPPVITKTLNTLEVDYQNMLEQIEYENSCLSNIELQHKGDLILAEKIKKGAADLDMDTATRQTAQDLIDSWKAERSKFELAARETAADQTNDVTSLHRKLEHTLVLLTEQLFGDNKLLLLPQGKHRAGETLRQTAERVLADACGNALSVRFYGNAPCAFYKYKYPEAIQSVDAVGAKVFFFRAVHQNGNADKKLAKFEWLDKAGMLNRLKDKQNYVRSVKPLLL